MFNTTKMASNQTYCKQNAINNLDKIGRSDWTQIFIDSMTNCIKRIGEISDPLDQLTNATYNGKTVCPPHAMYTAICMHKYQIGFCQMDGDNSKKCKDLRNYCQNCYSPTVVYE